MASGRNAKDMNWKICVQHQTSTVVVCHSSTPHLACLSFLLVQHMEEKTQLTGQTKLSVAQVAFNNAAERLDEIQHLA